MFGGTSLRPASITTTSGWYERGRASSRFSIVSYSGSTREPSLMNPVPFCALTRHFHDSSRAATHGIVVSRSVPDAANQPSPSHRERTFAVPVAFEDDEEVDPGLVSAEGERLEDGSKARDCCTCSSTVPRQCT